MLTKESQEILLSDLTDKIEITMNNIIKNIISELPNKSSSTIADDLTVEVKRTGTKVSIKFYSETPVWSYLNYGTGVYAMQTAEGDTHIGSGSGGEIVPVNSKYLRFKSEEIARALGVKGDIVFLKSVKGIKPRRFFERNLSKSRFQNELKKA